MELTAKQFFGEIFINSYVCALHKEDKHQMMGSTPTEFCNTDQEVIDFVDRRYCPLNKQGHGIHFTPNGVKNVEGRNRKDNFSHINSWFIDIDIEDTKIIKDQADIFHREDVKENILGSIFNLRPDFWPSLTVETRNGYHLYWFALPVATVENFEYIQFRLLALFAKYGVDVGASRIMHMLRVPDFWYDKNGETGQILPISLFSTHKLYSETDMMSWLKDVPPVVERATAEQQEENNLAPPVLRKVSINLYSGSESIFNRACAIPVKEMVSRFSGSPCVNGEIFSFQRVGSGRWNLLANGKMTPNWVDENQNKIFSNNEPKFCNIIHFLAWYGHNNKTIAQVFRELKI